MSAYRDAKIDTEFVNLILGFNAIINQDEFNAYSIFRSKKLQDDIGKPEVVKAIYDLTTKGDSCSVRTLYILFKEICNCNNLFGDKDLSSEFKKWRRSVESNFIKCLLKAYGSNTINLCYVADHYYSENKSAIWTLLGLLSTNQYKVVDFTKSSKNSKIFNAKLFRETMRFYEKVFSYFVHDPKVIDLMYKDEMHILFMLWLSQNLMLILNFIDLSKHFKFIEQNILILIHRLCSSNASVPNLTPLFIKCKNSLEKTYKVRLGKDKNKFLFKAKNFESSNIEILNKGKDLFEPLMQYDINSIIDKNKFVVMDLERSIWLNRFVYLWRGYKREWHS